MNYGLDPCVNRILVACFHTLQVQGDSRGLAAVKFRREILTAELVTLTSRQSIGLQIITLSVIDKVESFYLCFNAPRGFYRRAHEPSRASLAVTVSAVLFDTLSQTGPKLSWTARLHHSGAQLVAAAGVIGSCDFGSWAGLGKTRRR